MAGFKITDGNMLNALVASRVAGTVTLLNKVELLKGLRVVELGCGDASMLVQVSKAMRTSEVYGVDIDEKALGKAREKGVKVFRADLNADRLPFSDAFFDMVLMGEVIEHLVNPDNALTEAHRVLKVDGYFLASTPNLGWWLNRMALLMGYQPYWTECSTRYNVGKLGRRIGEPLSGHLRTYTFESLRRLLELHGFKIVAAKGLTYRNLPPVFNVLDRVLSHRTSLAQIIIVLVRKCVRW